MIKENFDLKQGACLDEQKDREGLAVDKSPLAPERETEDDEDIRRESEQRFKEKKGMAFIPENEIMDLETENFEDLILEDIDAHQPEDEEDASRDEFNKKGGFTSVNKNFLPKEIYRIKRKYALPGNEWRKLSLEEKQERNRKKQQEVNALYVKKENPFEQKKAA